MPRLLKQFLYGVFYLAIIAAVGVGFYFHYDNAPPSCFDGIQNEGEQGIDCGLPGARRFASPT